MKNVIFLLAAVIALSACSELELGSHLAKNIPFPSDGGDATGDFKVGNPYKIKGRTYYPSEKYDHSEVGIASWYGPGFHGKMTANGEIFNRNELTAAHRTLQMPSMVRVTNLRNGKSLVVRVNDRGPFAHDRVIDLSERAAELLGFKRDGTTKVRIDILEKESRIVASAAKRGISTKGSEISVNRRESIADLASHAPKPMSKPGGTWDDDRDNNIQHVAVAQKSTPHPVEMAYLPPLNPANRPVTPYQGRQGRSSPPSVSEARSFDNMVLRKAAVNKKPSPRPVAAARDIYVQAGAFSNEDNAMTMKTALYSVSEPVNVYRSVDAGKILYRVKIGPVSTVEKANEILSMLNRQGRDAKIVAN